MNQNYLCVLQKRFSDLNQDLHELEFPRVISQKSVFSMPEKFVFLEHSPVILAQLDIFSNLTTIPSS